MGIYGLYWVTANKGNQLAVSNECRHKKTTRLFAGDFFSHMLYSGQRLEIQ